MGKEGTSQDAVLVLLAWAPQVYLPCCSDGKESTCDAGDLGSIPGSGRSPGEGTGNPLQYSCLGNPMDRGAWWAPVHGVAKESNTTERLSLWLHNPGYKLPLPLWWEEVSCLE